MSRSLCGWSLLPVLFAVALMQTGCTKSVVEKRDAAWLAGHPRLAMARLELKHVGHQQAQFWTMVGTGGGLLGYGLAKGLDYTNDKDRPYVERLNEQGRDLFQQRLTQAKTFVLDAAATVGSAAETPPSLSASARRTYAQAHQLDGVIEVRLLYGGGMDTDDRLAIQAFWFVYDANGDLRAKIKTLAYSQDKIGNGFPNTRDPSYEAGYRGLLANSATQFVQLMDGATVSEAQQMAGPMP